jgi:hypothetical protein
MHKILNDVTGETSLKPPTSETKMNMGSYIKMNLTEVGFPFSSLFQILNISISLPKCPLFT